MRTLDGGADAARLVLRRYDRAVGAFTGAKEGELWDAVGLAHATGRRGEGCHVAVVDTGFDLSVPALATQDVAWAGPAEARTSHGTAVALLVHEVAPAARLHLYAVGAPGGDGIDDDLVARAVAAAADERADVVNLSLGEALPLGPLLDLEAAAAALPTWEDADASDEPFRAGEALLAGHHWRAWLRPAPASPVQRAVGDAVGAGCVVVAACGNQAGHAFTPAMLPGVLAVGFERVARTPGVMEEAVSADPAGYSQTRLNDLVVEQPPTSLGSSFAAPLLSGLVALMADRAALAACLRAAELGGNASLLWLANGADPGVPGWARRDAVVDRLFEAAINEDPHHHWRLAPGESAPCPECALLLAQPYVDGGLHWLNHGRLDAAERVLRAVATFAPTNPHAAANLGVTLGARAESRRVAGYLAPVAGLLAEAADWMERAVSLRPDHVPYRARLEEFREGSAHPERWSLRP